MAIGKAEKSVLMLPSFVGLILQVHASSNILELLKLGSDLSGSSDMRPANAGVEYRVTVMYWQLATDRERVTATDAPSGDVTDRRGPIQMAQRR